MIRPRQLRSGDRIALVAPASGFKEDALQRGVAELARLGFEAVYSPDVFARTSFEAGSAEVRARTLMEAWADPSIGGILAIRGGYGSQQLLPLLDAHAMREARKVLIGYSDVTALLAWSLGQGVAALHGPMIDGRLSEGPAAYDVDTFVGAISSSDPLGALDVSAVEVMVPGQAAGVVVAGTLTQFVSLLGTPWALDLPQGAILLLEDVAERPYRIHRMLTQLAQSGTLARAGGLVFGEFRGCDEPGGDPAVKGVLRDFTRGFRGPVLYGLPFGHTTGPSLSIPVGVRGHLSTDPVRLAIDEALVG